MDAIRKYPRTPHLESSRPQPGDEDLDVIAFADLRGRQLVVEEKADGANAAISFDVAGALRLQSRGHYLTGGPRERHFALFKAWAARHQARLHGILGDRYVLYGEWLYAKHTLFYDRLPHYFLEFDVLDTRDGSFLSTERRRALLAGRPVVSVPVLYAGRARSLRHLRSLVRPSAFRSAGWRACLMQVVTELGLDVEQALRETDDSDQMEGLYIKVEEQGRVLARYKLVRAGFLQAVQESDSHWLERPIVPNQLAPGVDLFAEPEPTT